MSVSSVSLTPSRAASSVLEGERSETTRQHLRGSNLLLFGRLLSLLTNFAVNVLTVRYLSKSDYGAFAYALAVGTTAANAILLGMPRAVARFAPIYQEKKDYAAMYGSLVLSTGLIAVIGCATVALGLFLRASVLERFVTDPLALALLLILIGLAPLQALDNLFQSMLAVFAGPSAIFFRRYVLGPLLRLAAVALVLTCGGSVRFLSWAYLAASAVGVAIYAPMLRRALASQGLLEHFSWRALRLPARDVLGFGLGMVAAEVLAANRQTLLIVLLGYVNGSDAVADFNAFTKLSGLNLIVLQSMKLLFLPVASRLYARGDDAGIDDLYWQTTIWISVITFPIFVPCLAMPDTLARVAYGEPYVASSAVLVALAVGEFFNAAMGLNSYTLQVYGRVRYLVWSTLAATAVGLGLALWLVPAQGALGAAEALTATLVLQNLLHHWGMHRLTGVELVRRRYLGVYASLLATLVGLGVIEYLLHPPPLADAVLVAVVSLGLVRLHRHTMDIGHVFPELARLPLLGRLLGLRAPADGAGQ